MQANACWRGAWSDGSRILEELVAQSIGVIGGTGPAGSSIAVRYAYLGHRVVLGSREATRAQGVVADLRERLGGAHANLEGAENAAAALCDIVVVATPWDGVEATVRPLSAALAGKVVISMANALYRDGRNMGALMLPRGSVAEHLRSAVPDARVVAAFHHVPAKELGMVGEPLHSDVLVCSDDAAAAEVVTALVEEIPGARGVLAGNLSAAAAIEAMTAVLINVNIRYKTRTSLQLSGIRES